MKGDAKLKVNQRVGNLANVDFDDFSEPVLRIIDPNPGAPSVKKYAMEEGSQIDP
jgi:hypothetical protein